MTDEFEPTPLATHTVFAPPTGPAVEVPVIETPAPRRGRGRWLVGGFVVAALVAVVAVVAGTSGSSSGYSLDAAAANAGSASNVEYEMTMQLGSLGSVTATARQDIANKRMAMEMALPGLTAGKINAIVDQPTGMLYMDASAFGPMGAAVSTKWISLDFSKVPGMKDVLAKAGAVSGNPLDVAKLFANATSKKDLGLETFRGEQVRHYEVTVDATKALDSLPSLQQQLEKIGGVLPKELTYDVWVTKDNELRRTKSQFELAGQQVGTDMVFTKVGDMEPIVIPDPKDTTDLTDLMGAKA